MSDYDMIAAMVERLRETDPWRNWKGNASFERQCEALLPVVREAVEREIVEWLRRKPSHTMAASAIERGEHRRHNPNCAVVRNGNLRAWCDCGKGDDV